MNYLKSKNYYFSLKNRHILHNSELPGMACIFFVALHAAQNWNEQPNNV